MTFEREGGGGGEERGGEGVREGHIYNVNELKEYVNGIMVLLTPACSSIKIVSAWLSTTKVATVM